MELDEMLLGISVEAKWQQIVPTLEAAPQIYIYIYIYIYLYVCMRVPDQQAGCLSPMGIMYMRNDH
jgi:hypothetical protein